MRCHDRQWANKQRGRPLITYMILWAVLMFLCAACVRVQVEVMCQGVHGTMVIREQRVMCHCSECQKKPQEKRVMSCTQVGPSCWPAAAWRSRPAVGVLASTVGEGLVKQEAACCPLQE